MIVTISGTPGSGKSTVAKILVEKLNAERIYVGGIWRDLAREKGMTVEEFLVYTKTHPEVDIEVDEKTRDEARRLTRQKDYVLVEGRIQFYFIPESIKIYVKVTPEEGAKRIWKERQDQKADERRNEQLVSSLEEMQEKVVKREEKDAQRYQRLYHVDYRDESHYDFILDTTNISAEEAAKKVLRYIDSKK